MDIAQQILDLIKPFVAQGKILPRTYAQINDNIGDFVWVQYSDDLLACAGLKDCQEGGMGEIYALAVSKNAQKKGVSTELLDKVMQKARTENFAKIFALSKHNIKWFLKQGFVQMQISELPEKRQTLFDRQRNSSIFFKPVTDAD
ncbi:N-acetylglutamate synthase [uncultured Candidatus Thioglobus sp.]|nr:N-acetylglutamate synthase [uncultured Candidatus Thioglobus sp.]